MPWWAVLLIAIGAAIGAAAVTFFITRKIIQKELENHPQVTADQIRAMYRAMGRSASEKDVRKVLNSMKRAKK